MNALASSSSDHLRILLVSEDIPSAQLGGLGKHVVALGNALIEQGHEVAILGSETPDYAACAQEVGFNGRFIAGLPNVAGWAEMRFGFFNPWKRPYFARRFARVIQRHAKDFDVTHYHGHLPLVGRYVPPEVNFLQTRHDQGSECLIHLRFRNDDVCRAIDPRVCAECATKQANPKPWQTALSAMAVERYRQETEAAFRRHPVVYVSDFLRTNYKRAVPQADERKAHVIHNFVNEARLRSGTSANQESVQKIIHIAGRLDGSKGILEFLDLVASRLPASSPSPWAIRIYGNGPLRADLEARHGTHPQIAIMGHRSYDETMASARAASLIVVPSKWEEPCGTVILEALRLGKPCLALRRGGTPELAIYGAPGQLMLFEDLQGMADGLLQFLKQDAVALETAAGESADISRQLPALLALYRAGGYTKYA